MANLFAHITMVRTTQVIIHGGITFLTKETKCLTPHFANASNTWSHKQGTQEKEHSNS